MKFFDEVRKIAVVRGSGWLIPGVSFQVLSSKLKLKGNVYLRGASQSWDAILPVKSGLLVGSFLL